MAGLRGSLRAPHPIFETLACVLEMVSTTLPPNLNASINGPRHVCLSCPRAPKQQTVSRQTTSPERRRASTDLEGAEVGCSLWVSCTAHPKAEATTPIYDAQCFRFSPVGDSRLRRAAALQVREKSRWFFIQKMQVLYKQLNQRHLKSPFVWLA